MSGNATAPTGRKTIAQGKKRSDAALGHDSQNTSSPEGAKERALPKGWRVEKLENLTVKIGSGSTPRGGEAVYKSSGVPLIRSMNVHFSGFKPDGLVFLDEVEAEKLEQVTVQKDDVLLNITGASIGRVTTAPDSLAGARVNQHVCIIRPKEELVAPFLAQFMASPDEQARVMNVQVGATRQALTKAMVQNWNVPVPPLPEQRRIVAEIEKQFTRLEAGVAALRRVQANLKRYRAAVLKAACEGQLVPTEAELHRQRKAKSAKLETGAELLTRILAERRKNWTGRGKYKEPAAPDTANLPPLPEGWTWVSWEMVLANEDGAFKRGPFGSALKKSIFVEKGFKVYEQYCPINDDCSFARYYITPEKFEELQAFEVKAGDYLISCSGVTLGRITRVPEQFERGIINQALLRVRMNESFISHRYFLHLFRSAFFQKAIFDNSTGSAIPNVKGVKELKAMAIPLPPLAEQTRIVAEVERRLSVVEELESVVSANLQRATRLRQSILQKAFTGELTC